MKKIVKNPWMGIFLVFIIALFVGSFLWALSVLPGLGTQSSAPVIADIYQDGELLYSIDLSQITENSTIEISGVNGTTNLISLEPGRIGMLEADCPDQLCVKQGFYSMPSLPITCLPNRVVIQLRQEDADRSEIQMNSEDNITPDIITY